MRPLDAITYIGDRLRVPLIVGVQKDDRFALIYANPPAVDLLGYRNVQEVLNSPSLSEGPLFEGFSPGVWWSLRGLRMDGTTIHMQANTSQIGPYVLILLRDWSKEHNKDEHNLKRQEVLSNQVSLLVENIGGDRTSKPRLWRVAIALGLFTFAGGLVALDGGNTPALIYTMLLIGGILIGMAVMSKQ